MPLPFSISLCRFGQNRTTFMIAHRLNMLRNCDIILVLNHGKLVEVRTGAQESSSNHSSNRSYSTTQVQMLPG
jgi:ABC-type bacteriocin/lantibiotic exporter with double-glycine peptidase domain